VTDADPGPAEANVASADSSPASNLDERVVESEVLHRGRYLEFRVDTIERADGSRATREIAGHPGAVAILAIDDEDRVLLVRQFRIAAGRALLELPAGTLDKDPATGRIEDPDVAAARELEEETGYRAGHWEHLGSFWTAPGFATELMHLYEASDLRPAHADRLGPDEDERLELERLPVPEAIEAAERGVIADAKSLVGLYRLAWRRAMATATGTAAAAGAATEPGAGRLATARFTLSLREMLRANIALSMASRGNQLFGLGLVAISLLPLLDGSLLAALPGLVIGTLVVTGLLTVPFIWFQARKRPELFSQTSEIDADEAGIRFASPFGSGIYPWSAFKRVREMGGFFFLDTGVGANVFIPLSAFDDGGMARFRALLVRAGFSPDGRPVDPR